MTIARALFAAGALALAIPSVANAMSEAACADLFAKADANKDGVLTDAEASRYWAAARVANKTNDKDGKISKETFLAYCKDGIFTLNKPEAGAPFEGANSFTEGQAQDRAIAHGLNKVSGLKKDDKGIWRGTAEHGGAKVNVAIDYKGNVVWK